MAREAHALRGLEPPDRPAAGSAQDLRAPREPDPEPAL